jgi:hypothetical protein
VPVLAFTTTALQQQWWVCAADQFVLAGQLRNLFYFLFTAKLFLHPADDDLQG